MTERDVLKQQCGDIFTLWAIHVRNVATVEEVIEMNQLIAPLNQAILQRLGPPSGTRAN